MGMSRFLYTSESVAEGHPDKVADQISDAVLDAIIEQDPKARVACESYVTTGLALVGGEITTKTYVDVHKLVRRVLVDIGYTHQKYGFSADTCAILNAINQARRDLFAAINQFGVPGGETQQRRLAGAQRH